MSCLADEQRSLIIKKRKVWLNNKQAACRKLLNIYSDEVN